MRHILAGLCLLLVVGSAPAPAAAAFENQVTDFALPNGLRFIVLERHETPLVSFQTFVNAGSVDLPAGQSGLGRLLERLAWTGTDAIGTRDAAAEKQAGEALEQAYNRLQAERNKGPKADDVKITSLEVEVRMAMDHAQSYADLGEFSAALAQNGAASLTASAGVESMQYACTLPSNRAELWFLLESQRLMHPSLRGFYAERDRMAQQMFVQPSAPELRLLDDLAAAAFTAHPYRNPVNGWPGDVDNLRVVDARDFLDRCFVPANITIAIVGDVGAADARRLAERYFGPLPARAGLPAPVPTREPLQSGSRTSIRFAPAAPLIAIGYKRPDQLDRDDSALDLAQMVLSTGSDSWLNRELVQEKKVAVAARSQASFPGGRYPHLFAFVLAPAPGRTLGEMEAALSAVLARLRNQPLDAATLARAKAQWRAAILDRLAGNAGAAAVLAGAGAIFGDWRKMFALMDDIDRVTAADVQRAAVKYFVPEGRTVVYAGPVGSGTPVPGATAPPAGGRP